MIEKDLPLRVYTGKDLFVSEGTKSLPLVDGIIYENDLVLLVGDPKTCKSIFSLQLAASISSGTPFLGTYDVENPGMVWYFATEGKDQEIQERLENINKVVPINTDNFMLFCSTQLKFNTDLGIVTIKTLCERYQDRLPKIIFIDSLYSGFKGTLIKDETVNDFITVVRGFAEACGAAVWMNHHLTKDRKMDNGEIQAKSDTSAYGSVFLLGQPDHIFKIDKSRKHTNGKERFVSCETQRSDNIVEKIRIILEDPSPLYFRQLDVYKEERTKILGLLKKNPNGLTVPQIIKMGKLGRSIVYVVLKALCQELFVEKNKASRYTIYTLTGRGF